MRGNIRAQHVLLAVLEPDATLTDGPVRRIHQRVDFASGKRPTLLRVVVEPIPDGWTVVTAYRTSKLAKYGVNA